jgi:hypothetical protein
MCHNQQHAAGMWKLFPVSHDPEYACADQKRILSAIIRNTGMQWQQRRELFPANRNAYIEGTVLEIDFIIFIYIFIDCNMQRQCDDSFH